MNKIMTLATIALTAFSINAQSQVLHETPVNNKASRMLQEKVTEGYFIVKFKDEYAHNSLKETKRLSKMSTGNSSAKSVGLSYGESVLQSLPERVEHVRSMALKNDLVKVNLQGKSADKVMIELLNSGKFEYVEEQRIYQPFNFDSSEYNDNFYNYQTYFGNNTANLPEGSGFATLRSNTVNNLGRKVRIAVVDSGSYVHEDVDFVDGYDFVTYEGVDENGDVITVERDSDPTDEYTNEAGVTCNSGHGLAVSSMIAAKANNGVGMVGAVDSEMVEIVPVRALGCDGGTNVDIMEAVLWSAGESIEGVPDIETPVDIVNMSLGGFTNGGCPEWEQEVFDRLSELGVTVVVAAGNENTEVNNIIPASCASIITVASTDDRGDKAEFSNFGDKVDIATFGTNIVGAFLSRTETDQYSIGGGTSYSTPLVAATVASMKLKYPSLTPAEIEAILKSNVTNNDEISGSETVCGRQGCGTGILKAGTAITAIDEASTISEWEAAHRYEGYDSDADAQWLQSMSSYVNACDLVKYTWGNLGTQVSGVSYKLYMSENGGEYVELETVNIPQKVYDLPANATLAVQACSSGNCGSIVEMPVSNLNYPASCR
tara:strand:- start:13599 stop:15404 length:1806 start_codon:yes stop_codon:yes gene_type:complete